jgi:hypothetical protein
MATTLNPSIRLPCTRLLSDSRLSEANRDHHYDKDGPTLLLRHQSTGFTNIIYQVSGLIVKTPISIHENYLEDEAKVYQHLIQTNASRVIPTFYGYFGHRNTEFIILSDEGTGMEDFDGLSEQLRYVPEPRYDFYGLDGLRKDIFNALLEIHRAHVEIEGFGPENVVIDEHGPSIIKLKLASLDHTCPGVLECDGLVEAYNLLGLLHTGNEYTCTVPEM